MIRAGFARSSGRRSGRIYSGVSRPTQIPGRLTVLHLALRIAVNTAKNHLVSKGRRAPEVDIDISDAEQFDSGDLLRTHDSPEANTGRDRLEQAVRQAIAELPEDLRVALTLRELESKSYEDIAAIMGCPVGTVRSRIFRARDTVSKKIEPHMDGTFREGAGQ